MLPACKEWKQRLPFLESWDSVLDVVIERTKAIIPRALLLLSDPFEEVIAEYIDASMQFVARLDAVMVGALLLLKTRPGTMEIMNVSVYEDYQNKGIGRQLITKAIQFARESGMKTLEIGTGNPGVIQMMFYQSRWSR